MPGECRFGGTMRPPQRLIGTQQEAVMHSIFYTIGVVVVVLFALSLIA